MSHIRISGTAYSSGAPEFTPLLSGVRVIRSLVLYICLSFLRYTDSDCPFGIFKLFFALLNGNLKLLMPILLCSLYTRPTSSVCYLTETTVHQHFTRLRNIIINTKIKSSLSNFNVAILREKQQTFFKS